MRITLLLLVGLSACAKGKIIRDAGTFRIETEAAVARQVEAAAALRSAAEAAVAAGDWEACIAYAGPVLLIEAAAAVQGERALYLAGLVEDDPGASPDPANPTTICGEKPAKEAPDASE